MWRGFSLRMSALAMVVRKSFNGKFTARIVFLIRHFNATTADADVVSLKSPHTLFDKYLTTRLVKFEQNYVAQNIQNVSYSQNVELFGKNG